MVVWLENVGECVDNVVLMLSGCDRMIGVRSVYKEISFVLSEDDLEMKCGEWYRL